MACLKLRHVCLTVVLFSIGISSCRGQGGGGAGGGGAVVPGTQDAIQIVAQAALCFDNRQVINGCLQSMGINVTTTTGGSGATTSAPAAANGSAAATMCSAPCFGQMTMMMGCVNGIFGNFAGYSPGLMQGVQAVFQMACGNVNGQGGARAAAGGGGGGSAGASGGSGGGGGGAGGATGGGAGSGNASPNSEAWPWRTRASRTGSGCSSRNTRTPPMGCLWSAISRWSEAYVAAYYPSDKAVQADYELQSWYAEAVQSRHADKRDAPWWSRLSMPGARRGRPGVRAPRRRPAPLLPLGAAQPDADHDDMTVIDTLSTHSGCSAAGFPIDGRTSFLAVGCVLV
ncbi:hypothetical protein OsJ_18200 [Oryza sativa Japonica Group]|uniref:Lipoxygenase domain-containing protein n=1 Tax=Oryza sativa subsp. japonica TaxID=39947 RepID=B9FH88_ORYSJ|nr:hypothetical protein OsJ_18200 [Oryza sativa Japonica Group]